MPYRSQARCGCSLGVQRGRDWRLKTMGLCHMPKRHARVRLRWCHSRLECTEKPFTITINKAIKPLNRNTGTPCLNPGAPGPLHAPRGPRAHVLVRTC
eukprot:scaffold16776_cov71-Phaeocystis_antarctica.AAC.6